MKILNIISEARKNPEQNPKTSINDIIKKAYDATDDHIAETKNLFVSFTAVDKLGINPKSTYHTPLGIYAYPATYVIDEIGPAVSMSSLPFAGDQPYANLFKVTGNIINLNEMTASESRALAKKITTLWVHESGKEWKVAVDDVEQIISDSERNATYSDYPGGRFWYITKVAAETLFGPVWKSTQRHVVWNKLFRLIGIDGCIDPGVGIIHPDEPVQSVFFSIKAIHDVQRIYNKYSPHKIAHNQIMGKARDDEFRKHVALFAAMSTDEIIEYFKSHTVTQLAYVKDKKARMHFINKHGGMIRYMKKQTEAEQIAAIRSSGMKVLPDLRPLTDKVIIQGLQMYPDEGFMVLQRIPNPSHEVCAALVRANPNNVFDIKNLTPDLLRIAAEGGVNPKLLKQFAANNGIAI